MTNRERAKLIAKIDHYKERVKVLERMFGEVAVDQNRLYKAEHEVGLARAAVVDLNYKFKLLGGEEAITKLSTNLTNTLTDAIGESLSVKDPHAKARSKAKPKHQTNR